jgi:energy-coupling factor transport system substrate-specific component
MVFITVVSITLGVFSWWWNLVYFSVKPFFIIYGLDYSVAGFWILPSVMLSSVIRKPGVSIIASVVASLVQAIVTQWGLMSVVWGAAQGLGAELIFLFFLYRNWKFKIIAIASVSAALISYLLDYLYYGYDRLPMLVRTAQIASYSCSAIILSALLSEYLTKRLLKIGLLNNFLIAKEHNV